MKPSLRELPTANTLVCLETSSLLFDDVVWDEHRPDEGGSKNAHTRDVGT